MKEKLVYCIVLFVSFVQMSSAKGQGTTDQIKEHFCSYLDSQSQRSMLMSALPTAQELQGLYKDPEKAAYFFKISEDLKKNTPRKPPREEVFKDCEIMLYSSVQETKIKELKPDIDVYAVRYLRSLGADSGLTYRFFVYYNNRWIFLYKPWKVDYSSLRKKTITEISLSENKSWTHESYIFTIGCSDIYSSHVPLNISTEDKTTKMDFYIADRKTIYEDSDYKYQLILETLNTSDADFKLLRIPK